MEVINICNDKNLLISKGKSHKSKGEPLACSSISQTRETAGLILFTERTLFLDKTSFILQ